MNDIQAKKFISALNLLIASNPAVAKRFNLYNLYAVYMDGFILIDYKDGGYLE